MPRVVGGAAELPEIVVGVWNDVTGLLRESRLFAGSVEIAGLMEAVRDELSPAPVGAIEAALLMPLDRELI